ncbi:MAG: nucleotidyl transferase AbiEii/AbiGii toxin family protein, partial [Calditrichaceae bacterium]|nr:nucleotidyl transferase AbiEii/AbiGii toxin family protein [Calditrichaceae bacterium]
MLHIEMRKLILHALYEDEWLYHQLILKGGNALSMIYKVGMRTSLDLDFSISSDFPDPNKVSKIIYKALEKK